MPGIDRGCEQHAGEQSLSTKHSDPYTIVLPMGVWRAPAVQCDPNGVCARWCHTRPHCKHHTRLHLHHHQTSEPASFSITAAIAWSITAAIAWSHTAVRGQTRERAPGAAVQAYFAQYMLPWPNAMPSGAGQCLRDVYSIRRYARLPGRKRSRPASCTAPSYALEMLGSVGGCTARQLRPQLLAAPGKPIQRCRHRTARSQLQSASGFSSSGPCAPFQPHALCLQVCIAWSTSAADCVPSCDISAVQRLQ